MDDTQLSYFLFAQGFVVVLNLMVVIGLWLVYRSSGKRYLAIAALAGAIEILRQVPDTLLTASPDSFLWYLCSIVTQFCASAVWLYALIRIEKEVDRYQLFVLASLVFAFILTLVFQIRVAIPSSTIGSYLIYTPLLCVTAMSIWRSQHVGVAGSPSRIFLILISLALFFLRFALPGLAGTDLFFLVYYLGYLIFPTMMAALLFSESEYAQHKVEELLAQKKQTEQDLMFILDHSLDVILTADEVGLLRSWNKRAQQQFGYTERQTVGKVHIDELFVDNYWHENVDDAEFQSQMEHADGRTFWVKVRMQTIEHDNEVYSIYVLRDTSEQERIAEKQIELDRELKRVHRLRQTEEPGEKDD